MKHFLVKMQVRLLYILIINTFEDDQTVKLTVYFCRSLIGGSNDQ